MPKETEPTSLSDLVRDQKLAARHGQLDVIESCPDIDQQRVEARSMLRQLVMQRVFDQFTGAEETQLLDRLWPLVQAESEDYPSPFGLGALNHWKGRQQRESQEPSQ